MLTLSWSGRAACTPARSPTCSSITHFFGRLALIASTISGVNAVRIYVSNLMTEPGETDGFSLDDHLRVLREHTGYDLFDYVLVNRRPLPEELVAKYASQGAELVRYDEPLKRAGAAKVVEADFACEALLDRGKIRHEPTSLAAAIRALVQTGRPATS